MGLKDMNSKKNESRYFEAVEAGRGPPVNNGGNLLRSLFAVSQIHTTQSIIPPESFLPIANFSQKAFLSKSVIILQTQSHILKFHARRFACGFLQIQPHD